MANFVDDNSPLPYPKTDKKAVPAGEDVTKFMRGVDWNDLCQAVVDLGGAIHLRTVVTPSASIAAGATDVRPHGLARGGVGLLPNSVMPLSPTPLIVTGVDTTNVTFTNPTLDVVNGAPAFVCERIYKIGTPVNTYWDGDHSRVFSLSRDTSMTPPVVIKSGDGGGLSGVGDVYLQTGAPSPSGYGGYMKVGPSGGGNSDGVNPGGNGGDLDVKLGNGGLGSGSQPGGRAGGLVIEVGSGGAPGGFGGPMTVRTGRGANALDGVASAGQGGDFQLDTGQGGDGASAGSGSGAAGSIQITTGDGGDGVGAAGLSGGSFTVYLGTGGGPGGAGGAFAFTAGNGGNAEDGVVGGASGGAIDFATGRGGGANGNSDAGVGGNYNLSVGRGGNGSAARPAGVGGSITFTAGDGGADGGGGGANGGDLNLTPGNATGVGLAGQVKVGLLKLHSGVLPTAAIDYRGALAIIPGGVGVADQLVICAKSAGDVDQWAPVTLTFV